MKQDFPFAGSTVLIVEDEYFIASDLRRALGQLGAAVLGPTADLAEGLRLADAPGIDIAILDVNLDGTESFPIADRLAARGIPWAFLTGYDEWALPDRYRSAARVAKPFRTEAVLKTLRRLLTEEVQ